MSTTLTEQQIKELADALEAIGPAAAAAQAASAKAATVILERRPEAVEIATLARKSATLHLHQQQHFSRLAWPEFTRVTGRKRPARRAGRDPIVESGPTQPEPVTDPKINRALEATRHAAEAALATACDAASQTLAHLPGLVESATLLRATATLQLHQQQHFKRKVKELFRERP